MSTGVLIVALALSGTGRTERIEQAALLQTFQAICLTPAAEAGALAATAAVAGFSPVRVMPSGFAWQETAAWERDGIRLFRMTDPREKNPVPMCGVSARLASLDTDQALIDRVGAMTDSVFGEGHRSRGIESWTWARRSGAVQINIDRSGAADVRVSLIAWPQRR